MRLSLYRFPITLAASLILMCNVVLAIPSESYAATPACDTNSVGSVQSPVNVQNSSDSYSVWLNLSGTKQIDVGIDIDGQNCNRSLISLNGSTPTWTKIGSPVPISAGSHTLRIHSYSNSFNFISGMLVSDTCIPISDGSNCATYIAPTTTVATTTTTKPPMTTTTRPAPTTTTTTIPLTTNLTPVSNITSQVQSCWWLWCSVKFTWSPSSGGNQNITYKVTTDIREPEFTKQTSHTVNWLPKGKTYPIKIQAQDSSGNKSEEKVIFCHIP